MGIECTPTADGYSYECSGGITIEVERLSESSAGLSGEVIIANQSGLGPRLLHAARLNVMSTQSRSALVKSLEKALDTVSWHQILEDVCFDVRERFRQGDPLIEIGHLPASGRARWLIHPYVEFGGPTDIFGDGGSGKSFLAEAMVVSVAGGFNVIGVVKVPPTPVLYLDWETDEFTHDMRVKAICRALDHEPPHGIFYRRQTASLEQSAQNLRREIAKRGIGFVVIDSMAAARGGEPESADVTTRLFNAARSLGVPWLGVDHVTKNAGLNGDAKKPFGSVFSHNLARMTWGVEAVQDEGDQCKGIVLTNYKANNGRLMPKMTYRIQFHNDDDDNLVAVDFLRTEITEFPALAEKQPLRDRIVAHLREGAHTYDSLSDDIGVSVEKLMPRMAELVKTGAVLRLPNTKPQAFGLRANQ